MESVIRYDRRQSLDLQRLGALFVAAWGSAKPRYERVLAHSFTWVTASTGDELVGFANVAGTVMRISSYSIPRFIRTGCGGALGVGWLRRRSRPAGVAANGSTSMQTRS